MNIEVKFQLIDKEAISGLNFPNQEVLHDKDSIAQRHNDLQRALTLGNLEYSKIKIYFEDDTSHKVVDTTIWGVTDHRIILKKGLMLPINRIHRIKF